jgi:hypothetical protein
MEAILAKIAYIGILSNVRFIHNFVLLRVLFRQVSIYYEVLFKSPYIVNRQVVFIPHLKKKVCDIIIICKGNQGTDNTIVYRKRTKAPGMIYKTLHRKLRIKQHELH